MNKKYILAVLSIIAIGVFIFIIRPEKLKEDSELRNIVMEKLEKESSMDFKEITTFDWDKLYVFTPYSNPKKSLEEIGIKVNSSSFKIEIDDTIIMLAFVDSKELVSFIELKKEAIVENLTVPKVFSKSESRFEITKEKKIKLENSKDNELSQDEKEYIKKLTLSEDYKIDRFKDSKFALVAFRMNERDMYSIVDLENKKVTWNMGDKFSGAYYKKEEDIVICTRSNPSSDAIWGKTDEIEYEVSKYGEVNEVKK